MGCPAPARRRQIAGTATAGALHKWCSTPAAKNCSAGPETSGGREFRLAPIPRSRPYKSHRRAQQGPQWRRPQPCRRRQPRRRRHERLADGLTCTHAAASTSRLPVALRQGLLCRGQPRRSSVYIFEHCHRGKGHCVRSWPRSFFFNCEICWRPRACHPTRRYASPASAGKPDPRCVDNPGSRNDHRSLSMRNLGPHTRTI